MRIRLTQPTSWGCSWCLAELGNSFWIVFFPTFKVGLLWVYLCLEVIHYFYTLTMYCNFSYPFGITQNYCFGPYTIQRSINLLQNSGFACHLKIEGKMRKFSEKKNKFQIKEKMDAITAPGCQKFSCTPRKFKLVLQ